jgi:hypothetical protein
MESPPDTEGGWENRLALNYNVSKDYLRDGRVNEHIEKCNKDGHLLWKALRLLRVVGRIDFL